MELENPIYSPAPIEFIEDDAAGYRKYRLLEVQFEDVKQFASRASKERVAIKPTGHTIWFHVFINEELIGCCGLYTSANKCRIKGDYFLPEYRGKGAGDFITECRLLIAKALDYEKIEVLTLHPDYYRKKGFTIYKERTQGVWVADKEI